MSLCPRCVETDVFVMFEGTMMRQNVHEQINTKLT